MTLRRRVTLRLISVSSLRPSSPRIPYIPPSSPLPSSFLTLYTSCNPKELQQALSSLVNSALPVCNFAGLREAAPLSIPSLDPANSKPPAGPPLFSSFLLAGLVLVALASSTSSHNWLPDHTAAQLMDDHSPTNEQRNEEGEPKRKKRKARPKVSANEAAEFRGMVGY